MADCSRRSNNINNNKNHSNNLGLPRRIEVEGPNCGTGPGPKMHGPMPQARVHLPFENDMTALLLGERATEFPLAARKALYGWPHLLPSLQGCLVHLVQQMAWGVDQQSATTCFPPNIFTPGLARCFCLLRPGTTRLLALGTPSLTLPALILVEASMY